MSDERAAISAIVLTAMGDAWSDSEEHSALPGVTADLLLTSDWLAEHDRQVAERAWDDALAHVDQLSDPARTIEITPDRELITLRDVQQAIGENPYRAAKGEQK